jgi:hypothetical protein
VKRGRKQSFIEAITNFFLPLSLLLPCACRSPTAWQNIPKKKLALNLKNICVFEVEFQVLTFSEVRCCYSLSKALGRGLEYSQLLCCFRHVPLFAVSKRTLIVHIIEKKLMRRLKTNGCFFYLNCTNLKNCSFLRRYVPAFACSKHTLVAHKNEKIYCTDKKALAFSFTNFQSSNKITDL